MARPFIAVLLFAALTVPAFGAVKKDGDTPAVNPCLTHAALCEQADKAPDADRVTEPMVIFLDAEGNTLARMPISKFRKAEPDVKIPPEADHLR